MGDSMEMHMDSAPLLHPRSPPPMIFGGGTVIAGGGGAGSSLFSSSLFDWSKPSSSEAFEMSNEQPPSPTTPVSPLPNGLLAPPEALQPPRRHAMAFDGKGGCRRVPWVVGGPPPPSDAVFNWFHIEVPRTRQRLSSVAQSLIEVLSPPLSLQEILALVSNGPFCGVVNGNLIFRVNSTGPIHSKYTLKVAMCISDKYVVSVVLGRIPRLEFAKGLHVLSDPNLEIKVERDPGGVPDTQSYTLPPAVGGKLVLRESVLEFLLKMNHSSEADNPIPDSIPELINHIIDTYVDQIRDLVIRVEWDLDKIERDIDSSDNYKRKLLNEHKLPKLHLSLQRILQVVSHSDMMMRKFKEKVILKRTFNTDDMSMLDSLGQRLLRIKDGIGFLLNRNSALQGGLDTWQSEQINNKLYVLSVLSVIFLPLSIITGAFGMNIGGVPWVTQPDSDPYVLSGWRNVMVLCGTIVSLISLIFCAGPLWSMAVARWRRYWVVKKWKRAVNVLKTRGKELRALRKASASTSAAHPTPRMLAPRTSLPPI